MHQHRSPIVSGLVRCEDKAGNSNTGTFVFTVTGFTVYSVQETTAETTTTQTTEQEKRRLGTEQSQEFYINTQAGQTELIGIADVVYIFLNKNKYYIDIKSILEDTIELKVGDNLIKIEIGKSAYIDLDNDKLADLLIKLESIIEGKAQLHIKEVISEKIILASEKEVILSKEDTKIEKETKEIPIEKSSLKNYLGNLLLKIDMRLFTSNIIKSVQSYPKKMSYLFIVIIFVISVIFLIKKRKKAKKDFKFKMK